MIASTLHYICADTVPAQLSISPWSYGLLGLAAIRFLLLRQTLFSSDVIYGYLSSESVSGVSFRTLTFFFLLLSALIIE